MKTDVATAGNKSSASFRNVTEIAHERLFAKLVKELGGAYASTLDINLASMKSEEVFKWFLASLLFGARIGEGMAVNTYREFEKEGVLSPEAILKTGWQGLVDILDRGGYARYDFKTATKLLEVAGTLEEKYSGDLNRLHFFAQDERDVEKKLQGLGKGVGPVTVNIFLRELRDLWEKVDPPLSKPTLLAAKNLGLTQATEAKSTLEELKVIWEATEQPGRFSDFEAALVRLGKNYCHKKKCSVCPIKLECSSDEKIEEVVSE